MGMYTELNLGVALLKNTPDDVIDVLKYMLGDGPEIVVPIHPLFSTERWRVMLRCDSAYFDAHTDSSMEIDEFDEKYHLNVRSNLKNYDNEIGEFLDFIEPYIKTWGFIGYKRYEEDDDPVLIYHTEDGIKYRYVD